MSESPTSTRDTKQVIVMRKDLNMRKGKMIAQGAHASLEAVLSTPEEDEALKEWLNGVYAKICVSVSSEAELDTLVTQARAVGLPCALITDAGRTEFHGIPTKTCCAIGPAWADEIDKITGALPLL